MKLFMRVYAGLDNSNRVKFGTSSNPVNRLQKVAGEIGSNIRLLGQSAKMPKANAFQLEWAVHRALIVYHIAGEWFACSPKTLAMANLLPRKSPAELLSFFGEMAEAEMTRMAHACDGPYMPTNLDPDHITSSLLRRAQ